MATFFYLFVYFTDEGVAVLRRGGSAAEHQFAFLSGLGTGLVASVFTTLFSAVADSLRMGFNVMDYVGRHPEGSFPFFGRLFPASRRKLRVARLRREIAVLMAAAVPEPPPQPPVPALVATDCVDVSERGRRRERLAVGAALALLAGSFVIYRHGLRGGWSRR